MTEAQDLFAKLGFAGKAAAPQPAPAASLACYLCDLHVHNLTDAELTAKRQTGAYRNLRSQDLAGYYKLARGK